jgi:23S rRNA (uracil1939-C5)-methyltransferase
LSKQSYQVQVQGKREQLVTALGAYPALARMSLGNTESAEQHRAYRLRVKLVAHESRLGLYAKESHEVIDIPDCRVMTPRVAAAVACVRRSLPFAFPLLALDAREVDAGVLVTLIVAPNVPRAQAEAAARALMQSEPTILGVSLARRAPASAQVLGSAPEPLLGVFVAPHRFANDAPFHLATPGGFVQAHGGQTEKLHRRIEAELSRALGGLAQKSVLELYAGAGALALRLARAGANITVSDSYAPSLRALRDAAKQQNLSLSVLEADAQSALEKVPSADAIIVDPPRKGLSPEVRIAIAAAGPQRLVYVSCEPRTLGRDLAHFAELGLFPESVQPWDMIPHSDAVETLAILVPSSAPLPRVVYEDERLIAVDKPAHLPTTPQGEHTHSLLSAVRKLPNAAAAVPVHRLDLGTSGVCLFAREPGAVKSLADALAGGQKQYLALVRGVTHKRGRIDRAFNDGSGVREAVTRYERREIVGTHSLICAMPETGRRHQIRRHLAGIKHPLLGDARYGHPATNRHFEERHGLDRPFLHLARVELAGERPLTLVSELAVELRVVLESLRQVRRSSTGSVEPQQAASRGE